MYSLHILFYISLPYRNSVIYIDILLKIGYVQNTIITIRFELLYILLNI